MAESRNGSDLKELIPEFYATSSGSLTAGEEFSEAPQLVSTFNGQFLLNSLSLPLGITHDGRVINDVELPTWSKGSSRKFVSKNRAALESSHVSDRLHFWIDLIFGFKSRGAAAEEHDNLFYKTSYYTSDDVKNFDNPDEVKRAVLEAGEFGIVPDMLFCLEHGVKGGLIAGGDEGGEELDVKLLMDEAVIATDSRRSGASVATPAHKKRAAINEKIGSESPTPSRASSATPSRTPSRTTSRTPSAEGTPTHSLDLQRPSASIFDSPVATTPTSRQQQGSTSAAAASTVVASVATSVQNEVALAKGKARAWLSGFGIGGPKTPAPEPLTQLLGTPKTKPAFWDVGGLAGEGVTKSPQPEQALSPVSPPLINLSTTTASTAALSLRPAQSPVPSVPVPAATLKPSSSFSNLVASYCLTRNGPFWKPESSPVDTMTLEPVSSSSFHADAVTSLQLMTEKKRGGGLKMITTSLDGKIKVTSIQGSAANVERVVDSSMPMTCSSKIGGNEGVFLAAGYNDTLSAYNLSQGSEEGGALSCIDNPHDDAVSCMNVIDLGCAGDCSSSIRVVTGSWDSTVKIWELHSDSESESVLIDPDAKIEFYDASSAISSLGVVCCAKTHIGSRSSCYAVLAGCDDGLILGWLVRESGNDVPDQEVIECGSVNQAVGGGGLNGKIVGITFLDSVVAGGTGLSRFLVSRSSGSVTLCQLSIQQGTAVIKPLDTVKFKTSIRASASDGKLAIIGCGDGSLQSLIISSTKTTTSINETGGSYLKKVKVCNAKDDKSGVASLDVIFEREGGGVVIGVGRDNGGGELYRF